jgi:hypothetical protein
VNTNENAVFDRLVDGELSSDERRALLRSLDAQPGGWRRCAIAFLEAQAWNSDFKQLSAEPSRLGSSAVAPLTLQRNSRNSTRTALSWAAIAASLLIAFFLGISQRGTITPFANAPLVEAPGDAVPPNAIARAPGSSNESAPLRDQDPDVLTLWARDESGNPRSFRVPLMEASAVDRELGVAFQPGMPAAVRSQLQHDGFQVHSRQRYAPLWLDNGQRMVLPVEDTKIIPVSENVY